MEVWTKRTLQEVKAANLQGRLALRNSLPIYLTHLVNALSITVDRTEARKMPDLSSISRTGKMHGRDRAIAAEYTIDQLILEYHILREVICDLMEREVPLSPIEREVIVCSIEQAVNDAATQFSNTIRDFQDQLFHTLAHDLRNPLSTVKMSAQMLSKELSEKGHLEKVTRIIHGADRIDAMIQELLDASKVQENAKRPLVLEESNLDWLVRDIAFELNITNKDRFQVQSSGECLGMWNKDSLRRIIENLATNAIKYGNTNTPVTLSLAQTKDEAILKVQNFGNPIPKEDLSTLFQKFKRGRSVEGKVGWGIGLNIVKTLVEAHHGTIEVESEVDLGTTFIVRIPKGQYKRTRLAS